MPMRWQQGKVSKLNNVEKKQLNPDGWWGDVLHVNSIYTTMLLPAGQCCRTLFFCLLFSFFSWFVVILRVIKILYETTIFTREEDERAVKLGQRGKAF